MEQRLSNLLPNLYSDQPDYLTIVQNWVRKLQDASIQTLDQATPQRLRQVMDLPAGLYNRILYHKRDTFSSLHSDKLNSTIESFAQNSEEKERQLVILSSKKYIKYLFFEESVLAHGPIILGEEEFDFDEGWMDNALKAGRLGWIVVTKDPFCIFIFSGLLQSASRDENSRAGKDDGKHNIALRLPVDHQPGCIELLPLVPPELVNVTGRPKLRDYIERHSLTLISIDFNKELVLITEAIQFCSVEAGLTFIKKKENNHYSSYAQMPFDVESSDEDFSVHNGLSLDIPNPYLCVAANQWIDLITRLIYTIKSETIPVGSQKPCIKALSEESGHTMTFVPHGSKKVFEVPESKTKVKISKVTVENSCCICFADLRKVAIQILPCGHKVCGNCLPQITSCPMCRHVL